MNKFITKLKQKAKNLKKEIFVLYYAYQDPKLPLLPKLFIISTVAYALSPIDLIPDFIPVIGYLDDLIILPLMISLSIKLIPVEIMEASREKVENNDQPLKSNKLVGAIFIIIWVILLLVLVKAIINLIK
ncbi:MAG: DUF1232 domain-containing protein [Spirochaetales bacterium]|nr:DUF1232 domain-containing protein [Spirochaetales bacterium]